MKAMTVNLKGFKFSSYQLKEDIIKNWRLILLFFLFLSGTVLGAVLYKSFDESSIEFMQSRLPEILKYSFSKLFLLISASAAIPLIFSFISSFNALGMPIILLIPAVYGFAISLVSSYLYSVYRVDGAIFSLLLITPVAIINALMLLICCNESLILSGIVSRNVFSADKEGRGEMRAFFIRYSVALIITALTCLADSAAISAIGSNLLF